VGRVEMAIAAIGGRVPSPMKRLGVKCFTCEEFIELHACDDDDSTI